MDGIYFPPILLYIIISPINQSDAGHHLSLLATWSSFRIDDWGHLFAVPTMLTELTAPFINTRVYLNHFNLESTTIFKVNGALAIVSWYYLRQWIYCTILALRIFEMRALIFFGDHVLRNSSSASASSSASTSSASGASSLPRAPSASSPAAAAAAAAATRRSRRRANEPNEGDEGRKEPRGAKRKFF